MTLSVFNQFLDVLCASLGMFTSRYQIKGFSDSRNLKKKVDSGCGCIEDMLITAGAVRAVHFTWDSLKSKFISRQSFKEI